MQQHIHKVKQQVFSPLVMLNNSINKHHLGSPRNHQSALNGGCQGMPALFLIILWIFCTVILLAISYSCLRSTCDPPPGDRTAAAATSTTAATSRMRSSSTAANTSRTAGGGAGRDVLSALPVFAYSTAQKKLNCSVCLMDLKEGEKGRFLPRCLHVFHVDCIDMWLATHLDCPVCRASVDPEAPELAV